MHRRELLTALAVGAATTTMASAGGASAASDDSVKPPPRPASFIESHDGTRLYWREWGRGTPVMFVHSWCLHSQMWDYQFAALADRRIRSWNPRYEAYLPRGRICPHARRQTL
jgi:non-heme chloroperoxidase